MTVEKITMPQLGESVTEGTITSWLVAVGDQVKKYDPIAEVQTDKVNAEVPSSFAGTIKELIAKEGETLEVGELICYIETESSEAKESSQSNKAVEEVKTKKTENDQSMKKRYSPAVLRLAQDNDINLEHVTGTGKGGRITRKDIQKVIESGNITKETVNEVFIDNSHTSDQYLVQSPLENIETSRVKVGAGDVEVPVSNVRRGIANNMVKSKTEVPHGWMMIEADVTSLVKYRDSIKNEFKQREGYNITYFAFFVKAVARALREYPMMNSMWSGDKIIQRNDINISIAVGTEEALYVPVIKHADEKSIKGIAREITELAYKVRNGKLLPEDMQGGTFTVNNTGVFGSVQSMGIINPPQAAILQVESIVKRPVVMHDDMIGIRHMINLCLSLDHRVLDGVICGKFMNRVKEIVENITSDNTSVY